MRTIIAAVAIALVFSASTYAAPLATYDWETGNVSVSEFGIGIDVQSAEGDLIAGNANANGSIFDSSLAPNVLSWLNFGGIPNPADLGNILPAGKVVNNGVDAVPDAVAGLTILNIAGFGVPGVAVPVQVINYIPEPTSLVLLSLGFIGLGIRRR